MSRTPTMPPDASAALLRRLDEPYRRSIERFPGETPRRQPVHTVYGGAHVFRAGTAARLGELARASLSEFAPHAEDFADALGISRSLGLLIHPRVEVKLRREPVEDYRIDFEDGYGYRPDAEEDGHAVSAAREVATGMSAGTLPPAIGLRVKSLTPELGKRALRTLDLFLSQLVEDSGGGLPRNFVVTLPKVTLPEQPATLAASLDLLEKSLGLAPGAVPIEIMIETPQAVLNGEGAAAAAALARAGAGRTIAAHFGTYDYTAALNITAAHQSMAHPACEFARDVMQVALAGTGVWISDGATNQLPIPPHRSMDRTLTGRESKENRDVVYAAWKRHYDDVRRSLARGYYQGWDLHPAQLPTRYAALYAFFLEGLDAAGARLKNFVERMGQATVVGEVFDDAATGQALLNFFLRAWSCGALDETEVVEKSGLTAEELQSRSFLRILEGRRGRGAYTVP